MTPEELRGIVLAAFDEAADDLDWRLSQGEFLCDDIDAAKERLALYAKAADLVQAGTGLEVLGLV
jgi:hypothetical protein